MLLCPVDQTNQNLHVVIFAADFLTQCAENDTPYRIAYIDTFDNQTFSLKTHTFQRKNALN